MKRFFLALVVLVSLSASASAAWPYRYYRPHYSYYRAPATGFYMTPGYPLPAAGFYRGAYPGFYGGYYNAFSPFGAYNAAGFGTPFGGMNYGYGWGAY